MREPQQGLRLGVVRLRAGRAGLRPVATEQLDCARELAPFDRESRFACLLVPGMPGCVREGYVACGHAHAASSFHTFQSVGSLCGALLAS